MKFITLMKLTDDGRKHLPEGKDVFAEATELVQDDPVWRDVGEPALHRSAEVVFEGRGTGPFTTHQARRNRASLLIMRASLFNHAC
jgi:hypothetical protein